MAKILIIEDSSEVQQCLSWTARKLGHEVTEAGTGDQGLELAEGHDFDLIISDLHLPGQLEGVELIGKLRAGKPKTPVIVVSGYPSESLDECFALGVKDFLVKPFELSFLSDVIERVLGQKSVGTV